MNLIVLPLDWDSAAVPKSAQDRLQSRIEELDYTPFSEMNCLEFECGVLDYLDGEDRSRHWPSRKKALGHRQDRLVARLVGRYPLDTFPIARGARLRVEPGDLLVTGRGESAHVFVVGPQKNVLWHSDGAFSGVRRSGIAVEPRFAELRFLARHRNKEAWGV